MLSVFGGSNMSAKLNIDQTSPKKGNTNSDIKAQLKKYAANVMRDSTVVETKKFAGQAVT